MKTMRTFILATVIGCASAMAAAEQDMAKPEKREGGTYHMLVMVDFEAGETGDAREIIHESFMKADEAIGREVISMVALSGEWDQIVVFPIGDSLDEMEYVRSAQDLAWWDALIEITGSEEAAEELMEEYQDMVERTDRTLVFLEGHGSE